MRLAMSIAALATTAVPQLWRCRALVARSNQRLCSIKRSPSYLLSDTRRRVSVGSSKRFSTEESRSSAGEEPIEPLTIVFSQKTVAEALQQSLALLKSRDIDEPDLSVTNLLASCIELPWETGHRDLRTILCDPSSTSRLAVQILTNEQAAKFANALQRRLQHEPIQYLLGQWDFYGHVFEIQPPLLCPRPETEELVQLIADDAAAVGGSQPLRILEIGSGTGCIGVSLASLGHFVHAIDIEPVAVETSRRNARNILGEHWNQSFSVSEVAATDFCLSQGEELFDLVVSNPPYIPRADYEELDATVKDYESADALVSGEDGMDVIRIIMHKLPEWTKPGAHCWLEVDPSQPEKISEMCRETLEFLGTRRDFFGKDRFVQIRVK